MARSKKSKKRTCPTAGPFFKQKRVGIHKTHFQILKFRTMKTETPKDTPTHLLENPQQYITRVGRVLRKLSLDELPQIFQIFTGKMSIIGPRPALWNQFDLIAERDKYGANDVRPGLTGWAQINGRDELEIPVKAALKCLGLDCGCCRMPLTEATDATFDRIRQLLQ